MQEASNFLGELVVALSSICRYGKVKMQLKISNTINFYYVNFDEFILNFLEDLLTQPLIFLSSVVLKCKNVVKDERN